MSISIAKIIRRYAPSCLLGIAGLAILTACPEKQPTTTGHLPIGVTPPPPPPPVKSVPLDSALQRSALAELDALTRSPNAYVRAHSLEVMQNINEPDRETFILRGLDDEKPVVRFAAAMAAGQVRLGSARDRLLEMVNDPDTGIQIAVRFALHRLGITRYSHDFEKYAVAIGNDNAPVRGNTVMCLGLLEEPSAIKILKAMTRDPNRIVRLQVAESLWRLGDTDGLELLVAGSVSELPDEQIISILGMAAPGDKRVIPHVRSGLTADQVEVRLATARALGLLGSDEGYVPAEKAVTSSDPRRRSMAALALGAIGRLDSQPLLAQLLRDNEPEVRVAACSAILSLK